VKPPRQPGKLGQALIRMLMKHAHVAQAEPVAEGFRLITLESPEFRGVQWGPGQKVQIAMGSAFVARTFTPIEWDAIAGRTRILGYAHGTGPGSAWVRECSLGDECDVFGPRASLDVGRINGICVMLGDETSIGLAHALERRSPDSRVRCLLEVTDMTHAHDVLTRLDLNGAELFERAKDEAHLQQMEQRLAALATDDVTFVLTGKASSIQRLRRALKVLGVSPSRLITKPYWAPGKTGLD